MTGVAGKRKLTIRIYEYTYERKFLEANPGMKQNAVEFGLKTQILSDILKKKEKIVLAVKK